MEKYDWQITDNSETLKAERKLYWLLILALFITIGFLIHDNLKLRGQINYDKHEHEYNVHKGLENDVR